MANWWEQSAVVEAPEEEVETSEWWQSSPIARPDYMAEERRIKNVASMAENAPRDYKWEITDKDNIEHEGNDFEKGIWSKIKESFHRGAQQSLAHVGITEALYTGDPKNVERAIEIMDTVLENQSQNPLHAGWFSDFIYANVQTSGQVWESIYAGGKAAMVVGGVGAIGGAVVGAAIPTVGEEPAAIGVGAGVGLKAGAKLGLAEGAAIFSYRQGMGEMYYEMIKNNADPEVAQTVSGIAAIPYALVEIAQLSHLAPGVKQALQKKLQTSVAKIVVDAGKKYGKTFSKEVLEEIAQKAISITARDAADVLSGNEIEVDAKFLKDRLGEIYEEGKGAAKGMALLPLPGAAIETGIQIRARSEIELAPEAEAEVTPGEKKAVEKEAKTAKSYEETMTRLETLLGVAEKMPERPAEGIKPLTGTETLPQLQDRHKGLMDTFVEAEPADRKDILTDIDETAKAIGQKGGIGALPEGVTVAEREAAEEKVEPAIKLSRQRKLLKETEGQIKQTGAWAQYEAGKQAATPTGVPISRQQIKVDPKYKGKVEAHFGERGKKGSLGTLWNKITFDQTGPQSSWDQAAAERGMDTGSIDDYLEAMVADYRQRSDARRAVPDTVVEQLMLSEDWEDVALGTKYDMLRNGYSEADIADEILRLKVEAETDIIEGEVPDDTEIRTISQVHDAVAKELEEERAAIQAEGEAPEVGDFLEGIEKPTPPGEGVAAPTDIEGRALVNPKTGESIPTNPDGTITLYHGTSEIAAAKIQERGRFATINEGQEIGPSDYNVWFSTTYEGAVKEGVTGDPKGKVFEITVDPSLIVDVDAIKPNNEWDVILDSADIKNIIPELVAQPTPAGEKVEIPIPTEIPESEITLDKGLGTIEANNLPPVKKGDLRLYRGFSGGAREGGGTFYTPFLQHAFQYAKYRKTEYGGKGGLAYIDVPHDMANKFASSKVNKEYLGLENVALEYVFPQLAQPTPAGEKVARPGVTINKTLEDEDVEDVTRGRYGGKQSEMFDKGDFKTIKEQDRINAEKDLPGQGTFFGREGGALGIPFDIPEPGVLRRVAESIYQNYINRFASIENAEKKAIALGMEVLPGQSGTKLARGYLGLGRKAEAMLGNKTFRINPKGEYVATGEGLKPILDSYDKSMKPVEKSRKTRESDFDTYLIATRTVEDLQRSRYEGGPQIVTPAQVRQAESDLAALNKKYGDAMRTIAAHARRLYEYQKRVLHLLVDAGQLTQKRYDRIVDLNQHYIPFDRVFEEEGIAHEGGVPAGKDRFTKARAPISPIKGSKAKVAPPIESVIKNTYKILAAAERNKVARSMARLGRVLPDDITPIRIKMVPIKIDPKEVLTVAKEFREQARKVTEEVNTTIEEGGESADLSGPAKKMEKVVRDALTHRGFSEGEANSFVSQIKKGKPKEGEAAGSDRVTKETIQRTIKETQRIIISKEPVETTIFRPSQFAPKGQVIEFFVNGKRRYVELSDNLYRAMTGLDETSAGMLVRIFSQPAHWLRVGATITPEFMARNPIRDQWTALMQSAFGFVPFVDSAGAIADILGKKEIYHEWLASGGAYAGFVELNRPALMKAVEELRHGKSILKRLNVISSAQDLSQLMEMATRLGVFKAEKRKGKTAIEAGFASREATIDFARRGAKMGDVNRLMAFFNAGIQGLDKTVRTSITHPYQTALKGIATITIPSLLLYLRNRDEDDYKEMAQWKKDLFWNFKIGETWWRVPKPFLFGQIYGSIPERLFEYIDTKDKKAFDGLKKSAYDAVTPISGDPASGLLITAVKPIIENAFNYNLFTERPIVPLAKEDLEAQDQYGRYTSEAAKKMGEWTNYSPAKIENLIRGWFGGSGTYALEGVDFLANQIGNEVDAEHLKTLADYPLVKGFVQRDPSGPTAQSISDFYEDTKKIEKSYNSYRNALKAGKKERATQLLTDKPEIQKYKALNKMRRQLSDLRKQADKVMDSKASVDEKKRKVLEIDKKRLAVARRGNSIIEEVKK